jgi:hypothetical protein
MAEGEGTAAQLRDSASTYQRRQRWPKVASTRAASREGIGSVRPVLPAGARERLLGQAVITFCASALTAADQAPEFLTCTKHPSERDHTSIIIPA